jgi:hypothetical protein
MPSIVCSVAAFAVASLFYAWRTHDDTIRKQHRQLRKRITFLLWVLANQVA